MAVRKAGEVILFDTVFGTVHANVTTERGTAREEFYAVGKKDGFGLNKRSRRLKRGDKNVTEPDGKAIKN